MTSIAVVVPAHNEERTLPDVLEGLVRQERDGLALDVVVVNDGSKDATGEIAERYAREHAWIRVLHNSPNRGLARSLRRGIEDAKGDVVITLHADIVPHRSDWLKRVAAEFRDPRVGAVGSNVHAKVDGLPFIDRFFLESPPRPMLGNKSDAYSRAVLEKLGGFDASFRVAGEDVDLGQRIREAGFEVRFPDGLDVDHLMGWHQMGFKKHLKKEVQYAEVQPRLYRRHGYMTTAVYGVTLPLVALNLLALPAQAAAAPALWAVNAAALALMVWWSRRDRLRLATAFALAYVALGAAAALALGRDVAAAPGTVFLLGALLAFLAWNVARALVKARRMREPLVALAAVPLFFLQDAARGVGFLKGARGFLRG